MTAQSVSKRDVACSRLSSPSPASPAAAAAPRGYHRHADSDHFDRTDRSVRLRRVDMNDDRKDDDDERRRRRSVAPPPPPATVYRLLQPPPLGDTAPVPQDAAQFAFGRDDYRFAGTLSGDMYVVPFGLENCVTVGMPGYVPADPASSLFQSLPSMSTMQTSAFHPQPAGKHQTSAGNFKDDRLFQLMTSSSSLPVSSTIGDGYYMMQPQHHQQQHDVGGYVEMTPLTGMERVGELGGQAFLPRCFGSPEMLPGYAPMQPPPASIYHDGDGVLQSYGGTARPSMDQFVFDVDASPAAALPSGSLPKPPSAAPYSLVSKVDSEPTSSHSYSHHLQHHQLHQLTQQHHQPISVQPPYRLPYPTNPPPPKSQTPQPPRSDVTSGAQQPETETDEINTRAVAARVAAELKRYSVPQAVFAQLVLCRSQGTLSDLLRNPKPWSKLKSGRETFRRMWKWLQEPEYQRMSALRFAGRIAGEKQTFVYVIFI